MGSKKDPNQKGSGAKKHRRNYRLRMENDGISRQGVTTRYRAMHGIPQGRRRDIHERDDCPRHPRGGRA